MSMVTTSQFYLASIAAVTNTISKATVGDTAYSWCWILPDGYLRTSPVPQVPTKPSAPNGRTLLPPYFGLPIGIPTLPRIIGPAIARARIPC